MIVREAMYCILEIPKGVRSDMDIQELHITGAGVELKNSFRQFL